MNKTFDPRDNKGRLPGEGAQIPVPIGAIPVVDVEPIVGIEVDVERVAGTVRICLLPSLAPKNDF